MAVGTGWSLAASAGYQGMVLLTSFLVGRILGKELFGQLGMIQGTVGMLGVLAGLGLGMTATKYIAESHKNDQFRAARIAGISLAIGAVSSSAIALVVVGIAPYLSGSLLNAPSLTLQLRIGCILIVSNTLFQLCQACLLGFQQYRAIALANLAAGALTFPLTVVGVCLWSVTGGVIGTVAASVAGLLFCYQRLAGICRFADGMANSGERVRDLKLILGFSIPSGLAGVVVNPVMWLVSVMLANAPDGYAELGIFNAARQWWLLILFVPTVASRAALPIICERLESKDARGAYRVLGAATFSSLLVGLSAASLLTLFSDHAMEFFGESFGQGKHVLVLMAWSGALMAVQTPLMQVYIALGRAWLPLFLNLVWATILVGTFHFYMCQDALGLARAFLLSHCVHTMEMVLLLYVVFPKRRRA